MTRRDSGPTNLKTAAVNILILLTGCFVHVGVVHGVGVSFGGGSLIGCSEYAGDS